jgi:hypothetical protein
MTLLVYPALILVLRVSGKRTLAKMNAFDLVITVALGSTLATILLSADVSLAEGVLALVLLVALQLAVAWVSGRVGWFRRTVKASPALLLHQGILLEEQLRAERVTAGEVRQAVRSQGIGGLELVEAVVLETTAASASSPAPKPARAAPSRTWIRTRSGRRDPVQRRLQVGAADHVVEAGGDAAVAVDDEHRR